MRHTRSHFAQRAQLIGLYQSGIKFAHLSIISSEPADRKADNKNGNQDNPYGYGKDNTEPQTAYSECAAHFFSRVLAHDQNPAVIFKPGSRIQQRIAMPVFTLNNSGSSAEKIGSHIRFG